MDVKPKNPGFRTDIFEVMAEMFATHPQVTPGKMFGFPAFYTGKKMFACVYEDGISLKLPADKIEALSADKNLKKNVHPFEPYNRRRMKEWIYIIFEDADDYRNLNELFETSILFVQSKSG